MMSKAKKRQYSQFFMSWDIETSKITADSGRKISVPYLSNILVTDADTGEIVERVFDRTMADAINSLNKLSAKYGQGDEVLCFCHNLNYEFSYLCRELRNPTPRKDIKNREDIYGNIQTDCIFRTKNSPIKVCLEEIPNVEFRCTYAMSNMALWKLGEEVGFSKLDYDYAVLRTPLSQLEQHDYDYNMRDNEITSRYIMMKMRERGVTSPNKLPLTATSMSKADRTAGGKELYGDKAIVQLSYRKLNEYMTREFNRASYRCYQGGLTTGNPYYLGIAITTNDMYSIDITSSYPYQMCSRVFPVFDKDSTLYVKDKRKATRVMRQLEDISLNDLPFVSKRRIGKSIKGYMGTFDIANVRLKEGIDLLPLSVSKCDNFRQIKVQGVVVNGKVKSAPVIRTTFDNVSFEWFKMCYDYDMLTCDEMWVTTKSKRLNKVETTFLLKNFGFKQNLKGVEGKELEYALAKVFCNNNYGIKVMKELKDSFLLVDGEIQRGEFDKLSAQDQDEVFTSFINNKPKKGNKDDKNFDIFTDGMYITAYARLQLITMMKELKKLGNTVIYADTDSLKFRCKDWNKTKKFLDKWNANVREENRNTPSFIEYQNKLNVPEEEFKKVIELGTWDIENYAKDGSCNPYSYFKTLGAKKYAVIHNNKIKTTVAGCSKNIYKYIEMFAEKNGKSKEEALDLIFDVGTCFDESASGRTLSIKEDRDQLECLQETYQGQQLFSCGGTLIEDTSYTLGISDTDREFLSIEEIYEPLPVWRYINNKGEMYFEERKIS